jgi:3-methyladenine DNA glycosylase/8-oxoguanine DNA glycosylase
VTTDIALSLPVRGAFDLAATLSIVAMGRGDPCLRVDHSRRVRLALLGPNGPVGVDLLHGDEHIQAKVSGIDAEWLLPYLPSLLGLDFQPPRLDGPRRLRTVAHRMAGMRLPKLPVVFARVVSLVLQQLISYRDATYGWRKLVQRYGQVLTEQEDLFAPPTAQTLRGMALHQFVECGILPQHARRILGIARVADRIEKVWNGGLDAGATDRTCELLSTQPGIGPWTIGYLRGAALGDSDAIVLGDYGLPKQIKYFFTGEEEATDDDMLALLEPYAPHRFYAMLLIQKSRIVPPRRGPRRAPLRHRF